MQSGHIEINTNKAISPAAEQGIFHVVTAPRAGMSSLERANKPLVAPPPHFTKVK